MITIVSVLYYVMAGLIALAGVWQFIKSKSVWNAACLLLISVPFALRAMLIK